MDIREVVFLSSVSQGMEIYRDAVYEAIESLDGYHCVRMEDFGARDAKSAATCQTKIENCTFFVGVIGHQYGSVDANSSKSYTELEYDFAVKLSKRRLMFMAPENFPVQAHLLETDDKRERQRAFRLRVRSDRQIAFFDTSDDLGRKVLTAIHNCQSELNRIAASSADTSGTTWLLFPFVTNQHGFDTGISIANVSLNPVRTNPQAGRVTLQFYGRNAPPVMITSIVLPGEVFTTLTSSSAPNFQGYIVAKCEFSPGRGYAVVGDLGMANVASGYLAEVMPSGD